MSRSKVIARAEKVSAPLELRKWIPVSEPNLCGREREYVEQCLETSWISSQGEFIDKFETAFAQYHGVSHAIAVCNGTVALHLAFLGLDIGPGDEVIVPTFTYISSVNAIRYTGATPIFVDCEADTWNLNPAQLVAKVTPRTKAILAVHVYGHPCDMQAIQKIAGDKIYIVEDVAEAFGSKYNGKRVGTFGKIGTFSFFGNKTITTGEGGMVVTSDEKLAAKMRQLKSQGASLNRRYYFDIVGYNYRMTNIQAAIGLAQMENADAFLEKKRAIAGLYSQALSGISGLILPCEKSYAWNTYWMYSVLITEKFGKSRDVVIDALKNRGVETRPFFYPVHTLPPYQPNQVSCPVSERVSTQGINLPSSTRLSTKDIQYIGRCIEDLAE